MLDWIDEHVRVRALFVLAAALGGLSMAVGRAEAADLTVTWKNAATYTDGSAMPSTDIASSTVSCGLSQASLTLTATVQGAAQGATVQGATAGKTYVCGIVTNSKNNGSSAMAFSNTATTPAPKPSPATGVTLSVAAADTTAYKMRQSIDGYSFVAIGRVAPGASCDVNHSVDGLTPVPRSTVTLASKFDTMPLVVFAKCS